MKTNFFHAWIKQMIFGNHGVEKTEWTEGMTNVANAIKNGDFDFHKTSNSFIASTCINKQVENSAKKLGRILGVCKREGGNRSCGLENFWYFFKSVFLEKNIQKMLGV